MKIEQTVKKTLKDIRLNKKEKIIVALSGGKDSGVVAYLLKKFGYNIEGLFLDLGIKGYSNLSFKVVKKLCKDLKIKLHVASLKKEQSRDMEDIWKRTKKLGLSACFSCGIMKKYFLNKKARELKASKLATGHHRDDELQTFLINIFKGSPELSSNFGPILDTKDSKFVAKIKPLFFIPEKEIKKYAEKKKIPILKKICPKKEKTYRLGIEEFYKKLSEKDKENMLRNFLEIAKNLRKKETELKITYCEICGEPSKNRICKRCELLKLV